MIQHVNIDIFKSNADIILHQVNCQGVMNSGIAKQIKTKYPNVFKAYKRQCDIYSHKALLGTAQFVSTAEYSTSFLGIFNLFGQDRFGYDGKCYTNYDDLYKCLEKVKLSLPSKDKRYKIAIPYLMGCHRGGGDWNIVYKIIKEVFDDDTNDILICEYNGGVEF